MIRYKYVYIAVYFFDKTLVAKAPEIAAVSTYAQRAAAVYTNSILCLYRQITAPKVVGFSSKLFVLFFLSLSLYVLFKED